MKAGIRISPVPRDITRRAPLPDPAPGTIVPVLVPTARAPAIIAPVIVPVPAPASMTVAARAMMVPVPARVPLALVPITGLMAPVPVRTLSFPG